MRVTAGGRKNASNDSQEAKASIQFGKMNESEHAREQFRKMNESSRDTLATVLRVRPPYTGISQTYPK